MRDFIIADNQDITRLGLTSLIATTGVGVGKTEYCSDRGGLAAALARLPEAVVVLDYTLMDFYGAEQLLNLVSRYDRTSWLLFSDELGRAFIRTVYTREQFSVVMKGDTAGEISDAVRTVYGYGIYLCDFARKILAEEPQADTAEKLTVSEVSILREIALGRSTKEIAAGRCLSFHTVNSHRRNIFRKLGVSNVQEAIRYALRAGLIDMADYNI